MSKRAKKLWVQLVKISTSGTRTSIPVDAVALIDAELRKERERAAGRVTILWQETEKYFNLRTVKAAILAEEED